MFTFFWGIYSSKEILMNADSQEPKENLKLEPAITFMPGKLADTCVITIHKDQNTISVNTTTWHILRRWVTWQLLQHRRRQDWLSDTQIEHAWWQLWTFSTLKHVLVLTDHFDLQLAKQIFLTQLACQHHNSVCCTWFWMDNLCYYTFHTSSFPQASFA